MITSVQLRNFQAHKDTLFEFSKGVNAIVGESDVGKSAVLRALYWVVFGRPVGDSMIRRGVRNPCEVIIQTDDGHTVRRVRGKTENFYEVDGEVLKAFGKGVPEDVHRVLNLTEINFSRQLDPPFALSMSGSELAQYLNKLIDLEVIGTSLSNINKMANYSNTQVELDRTGVAQAKDKIRSFGWIADAEKDIAKLEKLEDSVAKRKRLANRVYEELELCQKAADSIDALSFVKEAAADFAALAKREAVVGGLAKQADMLDSCLVALEKAKSGLAQATWIKDAEKDVSALIKKQEALAALKAKASELRVVEQKVSLTAKKVQEATCVHKEAALNFAKHRPEVCPLCGHKMEDLCATTS